MDIFPPVKSSVLVVDDEVTNLSLVAGLLRDHYQVKVAKDGKRGLELAQREQPDLILLDLLMPGIDGYEVCRLLKADIYTRHIPVIFLTSMTDAQNEEMGLSLGAADYIARPIRPGILLSRVRAHLSEARAARAMRVNNEYLEFEVAKRTRQLTAMQDITILTMASLAETRDTDTGNHLRRTQNYVHLLATYMQGKPGYADYLSNEVIDLLYRCAPLHDIGKVGIPDAILLKPGKLTADEFEIMKTHASIGAQAIGDAIRSVQEARLQSGNAHDAAQTARSLDFLETTRQIAGSHHEKWDGSGYPEGLAGDAIPLAARLMALADVFDALMSKRHYKAAFPLADTIDIIRQGRGQHFDPDIVDAFLALPDAFADIARRFADAPPQASTTA